MGRLPKTIRVINCWILTIKESSSTKIRVIVGPNTHANGERSLAYILQIPPLANISTKRIQRQVEVQAPRSSCILPIFAAFSNPTILHKKSTHHSHSSCWNFVFSLLSACCLLLYHTPISPASQQLFIKVPMLNDLWCLRNYVLDSSSASGTSTGT